MGVQIPRGVHSQVPQEGTLWGTEAASRRYVPQAGLAEGEPDRRRSPLGGSCSHDDLDPTEVRCFAGGRLYQGQECDPPGPDLRREEAQLRGTAFLGQRLLRLDRRSGRSGDTGIHQEPGTRRQAPGSAELVALIAAFRRLEQLGPRQRPQQPLRAAPSLKPPALPGDTYRLYYHLTTSSTT